MSSVESSLLAGQQTVAIDAEVSAPLQRSEPAVATHAKPVVNKPKKMSESNGRTPHLHTECEPHWSNAMRASAFLMIHLVALVGVFLVGFSWAALAVCAALYVVRMFAITGGYHRYFSHRSYQTTRTFQFILGVLGCSSAQKGPIWWASHHRHHHQYSDTPDDIHSPGVQGIWHAHVGWILSPMYTESRPELVRDLLKFPEIVWLEKYNLVPPVILAVLVFGFGVLCSTYFPSLGTSGTQMLIWGFFLSTMLLYHGTFLVNSAAHLIGNKRFKTGDDSRNSLLIALFTLGEGWHNNHHRYPGAERQGMYWYELDISHYILKTLSFFGIVWDLRVHPERVYDEAEGR